MPQAGPFGFEQGMTLEALERAAGPLGPGLRPHLFHAARAPEPHAAFESYGLVVSPDLGLVRVIAVGRLLHTDRFGTQLRREFESVREALSKAYGAGRTFDRVLDPRRKHPSEFVDALLLKGRVLGTLWTRDALLPPGVPLALVKLPPDVEIGEASSIWMNVIVRGDVHRIRIGRRTNIQDGTIVHVMRGTHPTTIGDEVTIGHAAVIHGCTLRDRVLVGMGAILLNGVDIGEDSIVAAGTYTGRPPSLVSENCGLPRLRSV